MDSFQLCAPVLSTLQAQFRSPLISLGRALYVSPGSRLTQRVLFEKVYTTLDPSATVNGRTEHHCLAKPPLFWEGSLASNLV